jgi:hypothetical protein
MGFAQSAVTLTFPQGNEREVWVGTGLPSEPPRDVIRTSNNQVEVPVQGKSATDAIFVWDKQTGNLASKTVGEVQKGGVWRVAPEAYIDVALVKVRVESGGKPVAAGEVTLKDGRREVPQLLDPAMGGEATFFAVKPGNLTVTVKYRSQGAMAKPVTQLLEAPLKRSDAVPTLVIALPAGATTTDAAVAKPAGTGSGAGSGTATKEPTSNTPSGTAESGEKTSGEGPAAGEKGVPNIDQPNPFGSLVVIVIALGAVGAMGYFALKYMRENSGQVSEKLEQLGVQIPKPGDDDAVLDPSVAPTPMPAKPAPPQKIMLDGAAPDPIAVPLASTGVSEPRLVAENGDAMPLPEGETVVGRELGLGLSLVGETTVSRRHAHLVRTGGSVVVKDLGSTNGTFVNGAQVQGDTALRHGDSVQFGSIRFRYEG